MDPIENSLTVTNDSRQYRYSGGVLVFVLLTGNGKMLALIDRIVTGSIFILLLSTTVAVLCWTRVLQMSEVDNL